MWNDSTGSIAEMLGYTPIAAVPDQVIWDLAVSPMVKATLGKLGDGVVFTRDTVEGDFPGDEVFNLNRHQIKGDADREKVRFPYLCSRYRTEYGLFIIKRDGVKIEASGWFGNPEKGRLEMIYRFGLRDRRYDGTPRANDSCLVAFPYDHPENHRVFEIEGKPADLSSLETSLYSFYPGTRLGVSLGEPELEKFVGKPLTFVDKPDLFMEHFRRVWAMGRFPGQIGATFPDVGKLGHKSFDDIARYAGYDMVETCPSHLHVVRWNLNDGYSFVYPEQEAVYRDIEAALASFSGQKLSPPQQAWLCYLQCLKAESLPEDFASLHFGIPWPHQPVAPDYRYLWLVKPLSDKARGLISEKESEKGKSNAA